MPNCVSKISPSFGTLDWSAAWRSWFFLPLDRKVSDLNWKIAHGIHYNAQCLSSFWPYVPLACFCGCQLESLEHLFFFYPLVQSGYASICNYTNQIKPVDPTYNYWNIVHRCLLENSPWIAAHSADYITFCSCSIIISSMTEQYYDKQWLFRKGKCALFIFAFLLSNVQSNSNSFNNFDDQHIVALLQEREGKAILKAILTWKKLLMLTDNLTLKYGFIKQADKRWIATTLT